MTTRSRIKAIAGAVVVVCLSAFRADAQPGAVPPQTSPDPHAGHDRRTPAQKPAGKPEAPPRDLPPFVPRLTDEDRKAAFPDVQGHAVHDRSVHYFALFDQIEWQTGDGGNGLNLDARGWIGRDRDRFWFRAEGDAEGGRVGDAQVHALYGRQFSRWWDVVGGVRQDVRPGRPQTWAAIGVQGLAPYRFEIEATAYVGASGRTHARFEVEYELLITNRLVLQPQLETEIHARSDPEREIEAGFNRTDLGFRLRYEIRRELAPYAGMTWQWKNGTNGPRLVVGLRGWF
jgi:copper resistance protein B